MTKNNEGSSSKKQRERKRKLPNDSAQSQIRKRQYRHYGKAKTFYAGMARWQRHRAHQKDHSQNHVSRHALNVNNIEKREKS